MISLFVKGIPKPQPRPRAMRVGKGVHIYTPDSAREWKEAIILAAKNIGSYQDGTPLKLTLRFRMPLPKSLRKKPAAYQFEPHIKKPDIDNLTKAVMDALTVSGVWHDDSQITYLATDKRYEWIDEGPGVVIQIQEDN